MTFSLHGDPAGQLNRWLGDFAQNAVGAHPYAVGFFVGLEVQVGRAALDRIEQHLVDETHHRRIIRILPGDGVLMPVVERFDFHSIKINVGHLFEAGGVGVEEFLDGVAELVVLDQNCFGAQPGAELDVVDRLVIGRVGNPHEQFIATSPEGQGVMLADQFFADQAFGLGFLVEAVEVQQGHAEMFRGDLRHLPASHQFVLDQITDQGNAIALGLLIRLLRAFVSEQFGQHQLLGQAAKGDVVHGDTGRRQFMTYSLVKGCSETSGVQVTKSVR